MPYQLELNKHAREGLKEIERGGDQGKVKQVRKALRLLEQDPAYPSLSSHRSNPSWGGPARLQGRDELWISWVRKGPSAERIGWFYGERVGDVQKLCVEYIGPHIDR
jgi:hypothetical protein